ncbi:hypothetical protein H0H93_009143 [Arthromyces matolae]|nr:hypothetical protein H0H93_009143 [Arthromyces matolae]
MEAMPLPIGGNEKSAGASKSKRQRTSPDQASGETSQKRPHIMGVQELTSYQDLSAMVDEMSRAGVGQNGKIVPWRDEDREWPDGLVRVMIREIFSRQPVSLTENDWQFKIHNMARRELNKELDDLWAWVIERKRINSAHRAQGWQAGAQGDLKRYKNNPKTVPPKSDDLARVLIRSLPKFTKNTAEMPWHPQENDSETATSWPDFWTKTALTFIWKHPMDGMAKVARLPSLDEQREILNGVPNPKSKQRLQDVMDAAWELWVDYSEYRRKADVQSRQKKAAATLKEMEKTCKDKYAHFQFR